MRSNIATASLCLVLLSSCSSAQTARPALELDGTGRVCAGHLSVTSAKVSWKTPLTSCVSPYTVVQHKGADWTLKLDSTAHCPQFGTITIHKTDPADKESFWNISGSANSSSRKSDAQEQSILSCSMF